MLLQELPSHSIQVFAGVNASVLSELLDAASDAPDSQAARPVLFLGLPKAHHTDTIIAYVIDQLAGAVAGLWPLWFGGEDLSELNDSALSHQYLPIKLATLTPHCPCLSTGWAEVAIRQVLRGRNPRVAAAAPETEWSQLCHAISPNGLIAVLTVEMSPQGALAVVHALEWLAANGNTAIAVLCRELPPGEPPFDRLLYNARAVVPDVLLPPHIDNPEDDPSGAEAFEASPVTLLLPPVHGRPHPQSLIEQRLSKMIEADAELTSKFVFNACVEHVSLKSPKVDLLWAEGRLVIELDGAEHRGRRAYRNDRHRDYEFLCAGYVVVRIPNDEIVEDFARTVEKIRSVVRLRRLVNGGVR
jgi:very-short-patch-repair endonuclease